MKNNIFISTFLFILTIQFILTASEQVIPNDFSPSDIVASNSGKTLFIASGKHNQIAVINDGNLDNLSILTTPGVPNCIALSHDSNTLFAASGNDIGQLVSIDLATGNVISTVKTGHTPTGIVVANDDKAIFICSRYTNTVQKFSLNGNQISVTDITIPVGREPVAADITPDGKFILVVNHLPKGSARDAVIAAEVSVIDLAQNACIKNIPLPIGSTSVNDITISPDGNFAYISHVLARFALPTTQLDRGWMNTNAVSIIDINKLKLLNTVLLDEADLGSANPWGVAISQDGNTLCVAHSGTHEVSLINLPELHNRLSDAAARKQVTPVSSSSYDVPNDLSFLAGIRKRVPLQGNGPRTVVFSDGIFYAAEYFTDSVAKIDLNGTVTDDIKLNPDLKYTEVRKGEMYFHDADFCFQKWQSCASCHPDDARVDGLNWDLLNDGIGNPKSTKSLLLSHQTPPAMATGIRADAETAVRAGMKYIQFVQRPDKDMVAIDTYLKSLKPMKSPTAVDTNLTAAVERGKKVYNQTGCSHCHTLPLGTNLKQYDVGTGIGQDLGKKFDTPALVELWRTAPYLNDGRAATIKDVLTRYNIDDKHGRTSNLSPQEIDDLTAYLLAF